jgi:hypothetical protein
MRMVWYFMIYAIFMYTIGWSKMNEWLYDKIVMMLLDVCVSPKKQNEYRKVQQTYNSN